MTRRHTLTVTLRRRSKNQPWGISISGGSDLGTPLIVTRSENEDLQKGDVIKKIDEYDVRDLRHVDAQNIFKNSDCVKVAIERTKSQVQPPILPRSPVPPSPSPDEYNRSRYSGDQFVPSHDSHDDIREERYYLSQPYRTTPLVLPGAKIKKDAPMGECYLRHHPNPMMRASPQHYDIANPEVAMKQKVVSKQFNSPIGLYSDQNIQDTLRCQASAIPKKPGKFDPSQSETYKALQEEYDERHEVRQPTRAGVFSPLQARHAQQMRSKSPGYSPFIVSDADGETIHQSNSFKRIMYGVLGETEY